MTKPLNERIAIITGAGQGIGAEVATVLAERGATVILSDILADRVEATAAGLRVVQVARDGVSPDPRFATIGDFAEISLVARPKSS